MKKYLFLLLTATLSLVSCSPFLVRSDYAETANFNQFKTYKLRVDDLNVNDLDKDRVLNALSKQLQSKGLVAGDDPDLIVNVKANHKKVTDIQTTNSFGYGWGSPWGWGFGVNRTWANQHNRGSLTIDIIDAKTQKLVWQAVGDGISVDSPRSKQKQIPQILEEMMSQYPPKK